MLVFLGEKKSLKSRIHQKNDEILIKWLLNGLAERVYMRRALERVSSLSCEK